MLCNNTTNLGSSVLLNKEVIAMQLTYMISAGPFVISHCCTLCLYVLDLLSAQCTTAHQLLLKLPKHTTQTIESGDLFEVREIVLLFSCMSIFMLSSVFTKLFCIIHSKLISSMLLFFGVS